jgi:hypothetical protein
MKAVLLDKPGPPSSLRIGEISTPRPGVDEALVRVCATSLNPVDYKVAAQGYKEWRYPHVLGVDVAGRKRETKLAELMPPPCRNAHSGASQSNRIASLGRRRSRRNGGLIQDKTLNRVGESFFFI